MTRLYRTESRRIQLTEAVRGSCILGRTELLQTASTVAVQSTFLDSVTRRRRLVSELNLGEVTPLNSRSSE